MKLTTNPLASFSRRHIGANAQETAQMLAYIGAESLESLIDQTVPSAIRRAPMEKIPTDRKSVV